MNKFSQNLEKTTARLNAEIITEIERITENAIYAGRYTCQKIIQKKFDALEKEFPFNNELWSNLKEIYHQISDRDAKAV